MAVNKTKEDAGLLSGGETPVVDIINNEQFAISATTPACSCHTILKILHFIQRIN